MSEFIRLRRETLRKVLANILVSRAKDVDAPCSAETHMAEAIVRLQELTGWEPDDVELREDIDACRAIVR